MAKRKVGAMWLRAAKSADNSDYYSVTVSEDIPANTKLMAFKNGFKDDEKKPDMILYVMVDD